MTFDDFIKVHRIDKHILFGPESNVYEYVKLAWNAADRAAREECAAMADAYETDEMDWLAKEIRETIK